MPTLLQTISISRQEKDRSNRRVVVGAVGLRIRAEVVPHKAEGDTCAATELQPNRSVEVFTVRSCLNLSAQTSAESYENAGR